MTHPIVEISQPGRRTIYVQVREPVEIGRECDGVLLVDLQASRRHAELSPRGESVVVQDLGSTNGTFLDGERVSSAVVLNGSSTVQIGDTVLRLVSEAPAPRRLRAPWPAPRPVAR